MIRDEQALVVAQINLDFDVILILLALLMHQAKELASLWVV